MNSVTAGGGSGVVAGPEGLPWPVGDPDQLRASAQNAVGLAEETDRRRAALVASGRDVNPWSGVAHQAYMADLERHVRGADAMASGLRETSSGLMGLAGALQQAQELIRRLAAQLADAREQARRAAQRAETARAEATAAQQRAAATAAVGGGMDPAAQAAEDSACAAENEAAAAQQRAAEVEQRAQAEAQRACEDVSRQDAQSSASIDQAQEAWWKIEQTPLNGLDIAGGFILAKMEGLAGGVRHLVKSGQLPKSWLTKAKWTSRGLKVGGGALAVVTSGLGQWFEDQRKHPNMDADERVGRAATQGLSVGGAAAVGAMVGSVVPGVGTVVGAVVGAGVGIAAGLLIDHVNDGAVRWVGNRADEWGDAVGQGVDQAKDWVGDTAGDVAEAGGKVADKLTFWN